MRDLIGAVGAALIASSMSAASASAPWFYPATTKIDVHQVSFAHDGATLRGALYIPDTGRKVAAVVVFHGASEPLANTPLYQHLREGLPQIGIAVLLFDRRGSGASTGVKDVPYQTLADDGIAGARTIRRLPQIDAAHVGYWGISQGGWLATFAASRDPRAAFVVAVSAPLVTAKNQMEFAMSNRLRVLGYSQADVNDMLDARRKVDGYFRGLNSRTAAVAALLKIQNRPWFHLMYLPKAQSLAASATNSSWTGQMDIDSFVAVERVKVPVLFILGTEDPWIPVSETVARLRDIARSHPLLRYAVVQNANHLMMTPTLHDRMNDADAAQVAVEMPQSPAYFMILAAWLKRTITGG